MLAHADKNESKQKESFQFTKYLRSPFWRTEHKLAYLTGKPPVSSVPHLRGSVLSGRLPYLQNESDVLRNLNEACKLAGDAGVCSFWVEGKLIFVIFRPDLVNQYKLSFYDKHMWHEVPNWGAFPGHSALNLPGRLHNLAIRRAFKKEIGEPEALKKVERQVIGICNERIFSYEHLTEFVIEDATHYFRKFALEIAARLFMGVDQFDQIDSDALLEYLSALFVGKKPEDMLQVLGLTQPSSGTQLTLYKQQAEMTMQTLLFTPHKKKIEASDNLLHSIWTIVRNMYSDKEITAEDLFPDTIFFLGGGIVASLGDSFPIVLQLICAHPEVEKTLFAELQEHCPNGKFNEETFNNLKYLKKVIKEAFRLNPPNPIISAREVQKPFEMAGVKFSPGDNILLSPRFTHRLTSTWGTSAEEFIPERFSEENEPKIPKGAYIPFGLGGNQCVGNKYATLVLTVFLAKLFAKFEVKIEGDHSAFRLEGLTMVPKNKMKISLTPRARLELEEEFSSSPSLRRTSSCYF
ncbi:MAG TPA: cytochrome P450 [Gammaproteobacteria bacterium]|jgi:cytochrome P450|nr:cytochrome P450 [Gammaproteobacteria bacterium]